MKIIISISKGLRMSKENIRQARGNKHAGTLIIDPHAFLILTTRDDSTVKSIMEESKSLEEYNDYVKQGESILMPWLEISMDGHNPYNDREIKIGQVIGHEGRHRAASLIKEGVKKMPISVCLYRKGIERRFKTTEENPWAEDLWTKADLPKVLYGEFNNDRSVRIDTSSFKAIR